MSGEILRRETWQSGMSDDGQVMCLINLPALGGSISAPPYAYGKTNPVSAYEKLQQNLFYLHSDYFHGLMNR
jgi:hypothetical protein